MVEFLRKFENHGINIKRVNSILITKSIDLLLFTLILSGIGGPLWSKANFRAQYIYGESMSQGMYIFYYCNFN